MGYWPWVLFGALVVLAIGLEGASRRVGPARVDRWVFAHRDRLPIPFLIIGVVTRLLTKGRAPLPRGWGGLEALGLLLLVFGESLRIWAVGIVGAATRSASTNAKRLVEDGPYAITRNPIYLGNLLLCLGLACFTASWAAALACTIYFVIVYGRIIRAEERFLRATFGARYEAFCRRVPRILPRLSLSWRTLCAPFSIRELRKEYQTIGGIASAALLIHVMVLQPWQEWPATHPARPSTQLASAQIDSPAATPNNITTITLEQALQRARTAPLSQADEPEPPRPGRDRALASLPDVARPSALRRMTAWLKRQTPGAVSAALAFAGTYLASNPEDTYGEEFEEQLPAIAGTTLVALAVRSLVFQLTAPAVAFDPAPPTRAWSLSPYVQVSREEAQVGIQLRLQF